MATEQFRTLFASALHQYKNNNFSQALLDVDSALNILPTHYQALQLKGLILKATKNYSEAYEYYEKAITYCPNEKNRNLLKNILVELMPLAELETTNGSIINPSESFNVHKKHKENVTSHFDPNLVEQLQQHLNSESYSLALPIVNKIISILSRCTRDIQKLEHLDEYYTIKAYILKNYNDFQGASDFIEKSLEINPNNEDSLSIQSEIVNLIQISKKEAESKNFKEQKRDKQSDNGIGSIKIPFIVIVVGIIFLGIFLSNSLNENPSDSYNFTNAGIIASASTIEKVKKCENIVKNYANTHHYEENTYDCDDMAMDVWNMLKKEGINARLTVGDVEKEIRFPWEANHAWVLAEVNQDQWLALEATGGYVETENPLYYRGWFFSSPLEMKEYRELQGQYNFQVNKYNEAVENYNAGVNQYNQVNYQDFGGTIVAGIDLKSAERVLEQRKIDLEDTEGRLYELLSGHALDPALESDNISPQNNDDSSMASITQTPTPTATPQINQDDITFRALIGEIDSNLDAIRADIQNQANAENIDGIMSALDRLKVHYEQYRIRIGALSLSSRYWTYKDYILEGLKNYERSCRDINAAIEKLRKLDFKTFHELMNQALGEMQTGKAYFEKASRELERIQ